MMGFLTPELMKEAIKLFVKVIGKTPTKNLLVKSLVRITHAHQWKLHYICI